MKLNKTKHIRALIGAATAAFMIIKENNLTKAMPEDYRNAVDKALANIDVLSDLVLSKQKVTRSDIQWCTDLINAFDIDVEKLKTGVYNYTTLVLYAEMQIEKAVEASTKTDYKDIVSALHRIIKALVNSTVGVAEIGHLKYDVAYYLSQKFYKLMEARNV